MSEQITSLEDLAAVAEGAPAVVEIMAPREPVPVSYTHLRAHET